MAVTPKIAIIGASSSGVFLGSELSSKYVIQGYNSENDYRFDGVTSNVARKAEAAPTPVSIVAPSTAPHPAMPEVWTDMQKLPTYSDSFLTLPTAPLGVSHTVYTPKNFGGGNETDHGELQMPSTDLVARYASNTGDGRYSATLVSDLYSHSTFRSTTPSTASTYEGTPFTPQPGLSATSQMAFIQAGPKSSLQLADSELSDNFTNAISVQFPTHLPVFPTYTISSAATQNVQVAKSATSQQTPQLASSFNAGSTTTPSNTLFTTMGQEATVDAQRNRSSYGRAFGTILKSPKNIKPAPYNPNGWINTTALTGIGGRPYNVALNTPIRRVVFKTKVGQPSGVDYWIHNYPVSAIKAANFVTPLVAMGVEYGNSLLTKTFVPFDHVVLASGVFSTVEILEHSGIGPAADLAALGIPCLVDLPVGKKVISRIGFKMRFTADQNAVGDVTPGTFEPVTIIDGVATPASRVRARRVHITTRKEPVANVYSADVILYSPISSGTVKATGTWNSETAPAIIFDPQYFTASEDVADMAHAVRKTAAAIVSLDPLATFQNPALPYPFAVSDAALVAALHVNPADFLVKNEYFGGASIGTNNTYYPKPVALVNGKINGTTNLRVTGSPAIPMVREFVNGAFGAVPAVDGDSTSNNVLTAMVLRMAMLSSLS